MNKSIIFGLIFLLSLSIVQAGYLIETNENDYLNFKTLSNLMKDYEDQYLAKNCYYNNHAKLRDDMVDERHKGVKRIKIWSSSLIKENKPQCIDYKEIDPLTISNPFNPSSMAYFNQKNNKPYKIKSIK